MNLITLDFETFYDLDYSLSKLTTEEYVRDPRFEVILVGVKVNGDKPYWFSGSMKEVRQHLESLDIPNSALLAHHAHFDGLILNHHFELRPKIWFDTLSMARAQRGKNMGNSLAKLLDEFGLPYKKGEQVHRYKGKRRRTFSEWELNDYGTYCCNDCDSEHALFHVLLPHFIKPELRLIDKIIRMFTEPILTLDAEALERYADEIALDKDTALLKAGIQLPDVMSNEKFAECLRFLGVEPPLKVNKKGDLAYAFAKTDQGMIDLQDHPDELVQFAVAARLKNKTTLAETRARRLVGMAKRGAACVYLNYSGASNTHRLSGGDKMNWQNNHRGGAVRKAILAPEGYMIVVGDSKNIESRVLDWLAGQADAVEAYRRYDKGKGPDIYCVTAAKIYGREITENDKTERQMGKVTKLGLGYGMGPPKFQITVKAQVKIAIEASTAANVVKLYRAGHSQVVALWKRCDQALWAIFRGQEVPVDIRGVVSTCKEGLLLPNGLVIRYPDLAWDKAEGFSYFNGKTREKLYGGKVCENIIQALARIIVLDQCMMVADKYRFVKTVHDEGVFCVREKRAQQCLDDLIAAMRTPLPWCGDLPLNADGGYHRSYGLAKK